MIFAKPKPRYIFSPTQLIAYQETALRYLKLNLGKYSAYQTMVTSGTTGGKPKSYKYSLPEYLLLEQYHFEKICYLNDLDTHLRIAWIVPRHYLNADQRSTRQIYLDNNVPSLNDNVYVVPVPSDASEKEWADTYHKIVNLSPGLVYTSPSSFTFSAFALGKKFPQMKCPVMFSGETLFNHIRMKALENFTGVIDKMRCWDTGFSFIECKYGTKHIDDELCLAVQQNNEIITTDFFNYAATEIDHKTGDLGKIQMAECRCGLYGRILTHFTGKSMQCLWTKDGRMCDPIAITGWISSFLTHHEQCDLEYIIRQRRDGTITLFVESQTDELRQNSVINIKLIIEKMLSQPVEVVKHIPRNTNKLLVTASEFSNSDTTQ